MFKTTSAFLCLLLVAACGGSSTPAIETVSVTPSRVTNANLNFEVSRDAETGVVIFDPDPSTPETLVFSPDATLDLVGFQGLSTPDGSSRYLRIGTENSIVGLFSSDDSVAEGFDGTIIVRSVDAEIPVSGAAGYGGNYAAFLTGDGASTIGDTVTGLATFTIDFETGLTLGRIHRRTTDTGTVLADFDVIGDFAIQDGNSAADGLLEDDGITSGFAVFQGLVNGPDAEELAGVVTVLHTISDGRPFAGSEVRENGGFLANRID